MAQTLALNLSSRIPIPYARGMSSRDDAERMLAYARGDAGAFELLYVKYKDSLFRYLLRMSGDSSTAEDLAQEVWMKLIRARRRYRPEARFSTYLFRIAHNAFIDHTRRTRQPANHRTLGPENLQTCESTPLDTVERLRLRECFLAALAKLPRDQRDAYLLHEEAGLSVETIATVTGVTGETAKSRIRYAVTKLKRALREATNTPERAS